QEADRRVEKLRVRLAVPQGFGRQTRQALLERHGRHPLHGVQGNRGRALQPSHRRVTTSISQQRRGSPRMILDFLRDRGGNYAMLTGLAMLPIMGGMAIAVDFSEMNRQKQATVNALDAAGLATARQVASGVSDAALIA